MRPRPYLLLPVLFALVVAGCDGDRAPGPSTAALPGTVAIPAPERPIANMEVVEDNSEEVANRFVEFADRLRRRDFDTARGWLADEFAGHAFDGVPLDGTDTLPLATTRERHDVSGARVVGPDRFLDSIRAWIGPWERVEAVVWKVKGAEFQSGRPLWGRIRFKVTMLGTDADGGPASVTAWAWARVRKDAAWSLVALELISLEHVRRDRALFTDVATSAGVAHAGIRFGQPGNRSFAWNGAAGGDVNGDGLWDLFVPSAQRNFLYVARPAGGFRDEAEERGLAAPAGGTGAVFFDYDNDGDQDLAVADVAWKGGGNPLRLFENDGTGRFEDVGPKVGFDARTHAYSLTVLDADLDGWLDVFVCNYGRVADEPNDSWIQAGNGTPNLFFRNVGGRFEEQAAARGLVDTAWTYAAAAADFDLDGDQDLYVANDYGVNQLWLNDGRGAFTSGAEALGVTDLGNGMGAAWGDLDSDGALDLYVSNMSSTAGRRILERLASRDGAWAELSKLAAGNTIFLARGEGLERLPPERGGIGGSWAWSPTLVDLDLDGRLDVYCCSGFVTGDTPADT